MSIDTTKQRKIQNKTAIITDSSRGIGKETAIQLADNVGNLVMCSRTQSEINSAVTEIENVNNQVRVLGLKCDVRVSSQVNSLVQSASDKFGSETIDVLVKCSFSYFSWFSILLLIISSIRLPMRLGLQLGIKGMQDKEATSRTSLPFH